MSIRCAAHDNPKVGGSAGVPAIYPAKAELVPVKGVGGHGGNVVVGQVGCGEQAGIGSGQRMASSKPVVQTHAQVLTKGGVHSHEILRRTRVLVEERSLYPGRRKDFGGKFAGGFVGGDVLCREPHIQFLFENRPDRLPNPHCRHIDGRGTDATLSGKTYGMTLCCIAPTLPGRRRHRSGFQFAIGRPRPHQQCQRYLIPVKASVSLEFGGSTRHRTIAQGGVKDFPDVRSGLSVGEIPGPHWNGFLSAWKAHPRQ